MLITDLIRLATRMFRTNRSRTLLTILGISVGIGAILFLVSLGYGLQKMILEKITTSDALLSLDVTAGEIDGLKLNQESLVGIKKIAGVAETSPLVTAQAQMNIDDISSELAVNFVSREFLKLDGTVLKKGVYYSDEDSDKHKIIISSSALKLFNLTEDQIFDKTIKFSLFLASDSKGDDNITRNFVNLEGDFKVVGIVDEESSNYVYLPFSQSQVLKSADFSKVKVKVASEKELDTVRDAIIEQGYLVSALSDTIAQANQIFKIVQIVLASFGIVALVVSAIGMFNTMTIALLERTQEIGIMKSLGATSADVWKMFLTESLIIGFLGGSGGIGIGMLGGQIFNFGLNFLAGAFGGQKINMFFTPLWFIMVIMTFSTVVGVITGFYPARRAARISALEALRYK